MLVVNGGILVYLHGVNEKINTDVMTAQSGATLAREWRHLTQMSVERSIVAAMSPDETLAAQQRALMSKGIERINVLQKQDRKSTRLNSSHLVISYAVFCLKKKKKIYSTAISTTCRWKHLNIHRVDVGNPRRCQ